MWLGFPVSPVVLGFVLGPMLEENFRRVMPMSGGDFMVYFEWPISACFIAASALLIIVRVGLAFAASVRSSQWCKRYRRDTPRA